MPSELKPCPFCGGEAEFHTDPGPTGECYGWVGCNQCDAMSTHCDIRSMQPEELHPIDAWNARVDADRIEALQAALEWYAEQVAGCRKITREGTTARNKLDADGGKIARQALKGTDNAK